jgi:phosphohistidine phosphatase SixA|tara:strand:+ start:875 stop:1396 length:522 start_codon:yes stop_codon:yes gene_type:complete
MKKIKHLNLLKLLFLVFSISPMTPLRGQTETTTVIYLVRHAEKVDDSNDAALSPEGRKRAELLSKVLKDAEITHIHSTDFQRTRDTVEPLASLLGIAIQLYDPQHLETFSENLINTQGVHLVSGHSNTTPGLVELLGGQSSPIQDHEYDRLYVIVRDGKQTKATILIHYGISW